MLPLLFLQVVHQIAEDNVDIPAGGGSGTGGGLSGFLPGQNYSMTAEQIVDNPVPRPGVDGDLQSLHRGQSSTAFSEQIAEFPDPGRGLQNFQPVQGSAAYSSVSPGKAGHGVAQSRACQTWSKNGTWRISTDNWTVCTVGTCLCTHNRNIQPLSKN